MLVLLHRKPVTGEPLGAWSIPEAGTPLLKYRDASAQQYAEELIAENQAEADWPKLATRLAESYPAAAWWELLDTAELDLPPLAQAEEPASDENRAIEGVLVLALQSWAGTKAMPGSSRFDAALRRQRFAEVGARLADQLLGERTREHDPGRRVSAAINLRRNDDDSRLVVVVSPGEEPRRIDTALAYGLTFQGDRDLYILLPHESRKVRGIGSVTVWESTRQRLAHVATPVRLFTYEVSDAAPDEWVFAEQIPPPRHLALKATKLDDVIPSGSLSLDDERAAWIEPIVTWATEHPDLDAISRLGFLAWHAGGRQVLHIAPSSSGGLRVTAGTNYSADRPEPSAEVFDLSGPISASQRDQVVVAVEESTRRRLDGDDAENLEHLLQDRLAKPVGVTQLGLVGELMREIPATRPGQRRAFIDLLGVDARGHIHVIETKLSPDEMLALQGLDYWTWLAAHIDEMRGLLIDTGHHVAERPRIILDYVVGTKSDAADEVVDLRYLCPQLEAFDGGVSWRIGRVSGWRAADAEIEVQWCRPRQCPSVIGRTPERFARRLHSHLVAAAGEDALDQRGWWRSLREAVIPSAHQSLFRLADEKLLHDKVRNPRSSQLFAINLFGGLDPHQTAAVVRHIDPTVTSVDQPVFEFTDRLDRLAESTGSSPHTTQVDVAIRAKRSDGSTHLFLIEVKLTEDDFNPCSAYQSPDNDRLDLCETSTPFGGDAAHCFQLRNHDRGERRRYDAYLAPFDDVAGSTSRRPPHVGCPFRTSGNQVMRNIALGGLLASDFDIDHVTFALCAHDDHRVIWRRWAETTPLVRPLTNVDVASLPARVVLGELPPEVADQLAARYALSSAARDDQARLLFAVEHARSMMQRVSGEGSTLDQIQRFLVDEDATVGPDETLLALAQQLEILSEQVRETRASPVFEVLNRIYERGEGRQ